MVCEEWILSQGAWKTPREVIQKTLCSQFLLVILSVLFSLAPCFKLSRSNKTERIFNQTIQERINSVWSVRNVTSLLVFLFFRTVRAVRMGYLFVAKRKQAPSMIKQSWFKRCSVLIRVDWFIVVYPQLWMIVGNSKKRLRGTHSICQCRSLTNRQQVQCTAKSVWFGTSRPKSLGFIIIWGGFREIPNEQTGCGNFFQSKLKSNIALNKIMSNLPLRSGRVQPSALLKKNHLWKSISFIFTREESLYSQSEWRTVLSHVEV